MLFNVVFLQVIIRVSDINDHKPTIQKDSYRFAVAENVSLEHTVGIVTAVDKDLGSHAKISYSIQAPGKTIIRIADWQTDGQKNEGPPGLRVIRVGTDGCRRSSLRAKHRHRTERQLRAIVLFKLFCSSSSSVYFQFVRADSAPKIVPFLGLFKFYSKWAELDQVFWAKITLIKELIQNIWGLIWIL